MSTSSSGVSRGQRLPLTTIVPNHYNINYTKIDFQNCTFDGKVDIECTGCVGGSGGSVGRDGPNDTTKKVIIVLHAIELQFHKATLKRCCCNTSNNHKEYEAIEYRYNKKDQTCGMVFDASQDAENLMVIIQEGAKYVLSIDFIGCLNNQMRGLYRSTYTGIDGLSHVMATTQFEPTDARRAFPCFDEPALKASFTVTVTIPSHLQATSNTPMSSTHTKVIESNSNQLITKTITFQKTPKMSTYLVALVVGQFDGISATSETSSIVTTVYTVPGKASQGQFCLTTAVRCLDYYQQLFGIPYPLTKSDLLAIPDFAAGAMENWGCVTYREAKILVKPNSTSETTRRGIARTVCHELAHQWFGNLVTMEFWTQLWLNEGFARFMEFIAVDELFPQWNIWTEFVQSVFGLALSLDAMATSHPVEVEVHHPDEINDIFDAISYAKGASIIRMICSYLGRETFFKGIRIYLSRHSYANAVTNNIWKALEEASGQPVAKLMESWVLHVGFPILMLQEDGSIEITRYLASGPGSPKNESETTPKWAIPIAAVVEGIDELQGPWVLNGPRGDETKALEAKISEWSSAGKWFKLNANQTSFLRVSYTKDQWSRLSKAMDSSSPLSAADRLGLISDSFAAGKAGYSSILDSLTLITDFGSHQDSEYAVWQELSENLSSIASLIRSEKFFPNFQRFLKHIYARKMKLLGWEASENETPRTGTLRAKVISMLGIASDEVVLKESFERFMAFKGDPNQHHIPGDLRATVFRCALRHDEATVSDALKQIYEASTFPEEQRDCLTAIGCVKDEKRHADMLQYTLLSGKIRLQDQMFPLSSLSGITDEGGRATWNYFKDNYTELHEKLGSGPMWATCVALSVRGLSTAEDLADVENFFNEPSHAIGSAQQRLAKAMEIVQVQMDRRERDRKSLAEFLDSY